METEAGRFPPADQKHLEQAALQRPWLRGYPSHLPADLIPTLPDLLSFFRRAAQERPGHEALRYFDAVLTYGDVDSLSDDFGSWLAQMGVSAGDRIGIVLQNVPHAVIVMLAARKVGAITVFCNPMYREVELATLFADFAPSAIVVHQQDTSTAAAALDAAGLEATPIIHVSSNDFQTACDARVLPSEAGGAPIETPRVSLGPARAAEGSPRAIEPLIPHHRA